MDQLKLTSQPSSTTTFFDLNNNFLKPRKSLSLKKCLFGSPDPAESKALLQEDFHYERLRVLSRYSLDLDELNNRSDEDDDQEVLLKENRCPKERTWAIKARREDGRKPYSTLHWKQQKFITDFCATAVRPTTLQKCVTPPHETNQQ